MRSQYVPVDEGEAEAQPALPTVTIRLLDAAEPFPRQVRFEVVGGAMRKRALDGFLLTTASGWLAESGYAFEGDDTVSWLDTEDDGRVRAVTYTLTGWLDAE